MSKVGVSLNLGADCNVFLAELTDVVERLEKAVGLAPHMLVKPKSKAPEVDTENEEAEAPELKKGKALKSKAAQVVEEQFDLGDGEEDKAEETEESATTIEDVIEGFRAYAKAKGRDKAGEILQKKFKVKAVRDLKPEMYPKVLAAIAL
jgi:hypothetical protein